MIYASQQDLDCVLRFSNGKARILARRRSTDDRECRTPNNGIAITEDRIGERLCERPRLCQQALAMNPGTGTRKRLTTPQYVQHTRYSILPYIHLARTCFQKVLKQTDDCFAK